MLVNVKFHTHANAGSVTVVVDVNGVRRVQVVRNPAARTALANAGKLLPAL
jgi:hypothetical protein